jgi:hypothetical protein
MRPWLDLLRRFNGAVQLTIGRRWSATELK